MAGELAVFRFCCAEANSLLLNVCLPISTASIEAPSRAAERNGYYWPSIAVLLLEHKARHLAQNRYHEAIFGYQLFGGTPR